MLQFEECLKCWDGKCDPQEQVQLPVFLDEPLDAAVDEEMKVEILFYICNLFSTSPLEEHFVWFGEKRIAKATLYEKVLSDRMSELFFLHDILSSIDPRDIPSLAAFLSGLLLHVLTKKTDLKRADAAYLSDYVLLSWWNRCFHSPASYCLLAAELDANFVDSLTHLTPTVLSHLARFPEHSNLVTVNLLRIYSYCEERMLGGDRNAISCAKQAEDPASRMLGIHANASFHQLAGHYSNCLKQADQMTPEFRIPADALHSVHSTLITLLQRVISCGLVASLRQRPDLPVCPRSVSPLFLDRFNTARDYYLTRACRHLAVGLSNSTSSGLPSKLSCIVHAAAPKHLFPSLLCSAPSCLTHPASGDKVPASFEPHRSLICWCVEHGLGVKGYALWFVSNSDIKDVHLAQCVLSRLCPHAALLASDSSFCLALIQRLDRVRKATLPEQDYLKLLRLVLKHLTVTSKSQLLQDLHSPSNPSGATPLPKSSNHWEAQTRKLFNRLVVQDSGTANAVSSGASVAHSYESYSQSVNAEFVLDCELLLLTRPVCFLTELIVLPISRRCLASQPAVHQLMEQLSYCLTVPIAAASASVEVKLTETDIPTRKIIPSLLESVLLRGLSSQHQLRDTSLLFHLKMEAEADGDAICFDPIFPTNEGNSKPTARSASQIEERLEGVVDPKHPLLETMRLLMKLARQVIPNLLAHLNLQLQTVLLKPVQPVEAINRFLGFLLDAILFEAEGFSESTSQEIVIHLLNLFELLFLSGATAYTQVMGNELDLLLVGVVRDLLRDTSRRDIFVTAIDRLCRLRETLRSHKFGPRILRFWILWFPVFDAVLGRSESGCLEVPANMSNLPGTNGELTLLTSVATKLGLSFSTVNLVPAEKRRCVSHMSPATLSFAFLLASMSPQSAQLVADVIILSAKSNSDNWRPDHLPNNVLLLALLLFLRTTSGDQQPNRWGRVFHVIDYLVRAGVIILSFHARHFETGNSSSPAGGFPLMDWSSLRGKLDMFAVYADLFYLWLTELPQSTVLENTQRSWELRLLCSTMSLLTQRLATYLGPNTDICDPRFSRIVRSQAVAVLQRFEQRLEIGLSRRHQSFTSASEDIGRLLTSVRMILHHPRQPSPHN
ncbi:hypothetical protein CRM22_002869 [Opisthorchis felineus]|uniref:Uncharacterized protein n=1 Tax=Opisthorchis felineus TaxID=147828 RepID=A0A4S2MA86_OPIFE|nr:hypothetical protein CRM22_002869 [Opisthorchis felineus]